MSYLFYHFQIHSLRYYASDIDTFSTHYTLMWHFIKEIISSQIIAIKLCPYFAQHYNNKDQLNNTQKLPQRIHICIYKPHIIKMNAAQIKPIFPFSLSRLNSESVTYLKEKYSIKSNLLRHLYNSMPELLPHISFSNLYSNNISQFVNL